MPRTDVVLHSPLTPAAVAEALRNTIDPEDFSLSFAGVQGNSPLIGEVDLASFRIRKRRITRNDLAGAFRASYKRERSGTRIQGYFDLPRWRTFVEPLWLALSLLILGPTFVTSLLNLITGSKPAAGDNWGGLLVPPTVTLGGFLISKVASWNSKRDQQFIVEVLQDVLSAQIELSSRATPKSQFSRS